MEAPGKTAASLKLPWEALTGLEVCQYFSSWYKHAVVSWHRSWSLHSRERRQTIQKISKIDSMSMVLCAMEKKKAEERIRKAVRREVAIFCFRKEEREGKWHVVYPLRALSRSCPLH